MKKSFNEMYESSEDADKFIFCIFFFRYEHVGKFLT